MADVSNRDEAERCKQIARSALAAGDAEKAVRVLLKAKRMCPSDASIDGLIAQVQSGASTGSSAAGGRGGAPDGAAAPEGMRQRPSAAAAAGDARSGKDGAYTADQARLVQRILRTKDYYEILEVDRSASEDAVKKAYKKLALKLHPDKNKAPGAEEAFKKLSKVVQCLTDAEKREMYGRYGDEDRIPQQQRRHYEQDFMAPEDLFNIFFGGGFAQQQRGGQTRGQGGTGPQQGALFQVICMVVILLTMGSGLVGRDNSARRFSFSRSGQYHVERLTATLDVTYFVTDAWEELHPDGTRAQAEFENLVEVNHIRTLVNDCEYQKLMGRRRASRKDRPACDHLDEIQRKHPRLYRSAVAGLYGGIR